MTYFDLHQPPQQRVPEVSVSSRLGAYVVVEATDDGIDVITYRVPDDLRPPSWPSAIRLPMIGDRAQSLRNAAFRKRVIEAIEGHDQQLEAHIRRSAWEGTDMQFSFPALAEVYRTDKLAKHAYCALRPWSRLRNDRLIGIFERWSEDRGHPSLKTIATAEIGALIGLFDHQPAQQASVRSTLNLMFKSAVRAGWRTDNPVAGIPWRDVKQKARVIWTQDDVDLYAEEAEARGHPGLAGIMRLEMWIGQRIGDVRRLRHGETYVDGLLRVAQSKTGVLVTVRVPNHVDEWIQKLRVPGSEFLFNHPRTNTAYTEAQLSGAFNEVRAAVSRPGDKLLMLQTLRHSYVVAQLNAGVTPYDIATVTGHLYNTLHKILERYGVRTDEGADRAQKELNRARGGHDEDFGMAKQVTGWSGVYEGQSAGVGGLDHNRAIQELKRLIGPDAVDDMID
jgi:hypothetical protein